VKQVTLFTDGSCLGNPGPGGWACLLRCGSAEEEICGTEPHTTNNRMELHAVIAGLSALKEACAVRVVTDFQYVQHAMTRYMPHWIARGWKLCRYRHRRHYAGRDAMPRPTLANRRCCAHWRLDSA
jgi:ribonuclease HI